MTTIAPPGNIKELYGRIRDANGSLYDPPTVVFHVTSPAGVQTAYEYTVDDEVTRVNTGVYKLTLPIVYSNATVGTWAYGLQALDLSNVSLGFNDDGFVIEAAGTL
jgi:hypothetical protein